MFFPYPKEPAERRQKVPTGTLSPKMALQRGEGLEDGAPMRNPNIDYALGLREG